MRKISVVIPVYNAIKYLSVCVSSVLSQTFSNYEIILVDDGSSDGSEALCDQLEKEHENIRTIHQKNAGASAARNTGLSAASGEYVHFIDSDDLLSRHTVYEELNKTVLDSENEIIFFRRERFIDGREGIDAIQPEYHVCGRFQGDVLGHVLKEKYQLTLTCPVNKIFLRRFLIENDLFFRKGLEHEEDEWLPRVIATARTVWFDKGVCYSVRNHPDSMSKISNEERNTSRACSKIEIAATGMAFMEQRKLSKETLSLSADYYWEYLIDACAACRTFKEKENRQKVFQKLKEHKSFFDSSRYLHSRNQRIAGKMFKLLGIRLTVRIIGIRYGK